MAHRIDDLPKTSFGGHDRLLIQQCGTVDSATGLLTVEDIDKFDLWCAKQAGAVLEQHYPGWDFKIEQKTQDKMAYISLPVLMGERFCVAVNLTTHSLDSDRVKNVGGEILERYGLPRGPFKLADFLEARAKHSRLIMPWLPIPG